MTMRPRARHVLLAIACLAFLDIHRRVKSADFVTLVATADVDTRAPDFTVPRLGGGEVRLSEILGKKPLVLSFFATWCKPCRPELTELFRLVAETSPDRSFLLVAADVGEPEGLVRPFFRDGLEIPRGALIALDPSSELAKRYRVAALPTIFVIDASGRIRLRVSGYSAGNLRQVMTVVRDASNAARAGRGERPKR